jgi:putative spermidine/putrescine transport system substrate-binding protein
MFSRKLLLGAFSMIIFTLVMPLGVSYTADKLTIASWGGAYTESQRIVFFQPFKEATGVTVLEDQWTGDIAKVRAMVDKKNYSVHIVDMSGGEMIALCDEGKLERFDYAKLGVSPNDMLSGAAQKCGVGNICFGGIFAYDGDRIKGDTPKNWADFWNVTKFPGKRGVYKSPKYTLEQALLADGVPVNKLYEVLRTEDGIKQAFRKLDELKPHIVWWSTGAQPPQLLADKEVVMTAGWNGRFTAANQKDKKNFVIVWDGQGLDYEFFTIPAGHPETDLAYKFIAFATNPKRMGEQTKYAAYGPLHKDASKYVDPKVLPDLPTAPENLKNSYVSDLQFWADNREALTVRFETWMAK